MNWRLLLGAAALVLGLAACGDSSEGGDALTCEGETVLCGGACADTSTDPRNCGACGTTCGAGEICDGGACALVCPAGQIACDGGCHDVSTSPDHCGECGNACGAGEACSAGVCAGGCPAGQTECAGGCFDTDTSRAHCGACGVECGDGESCTDGACVAACPGGQELCDGACFDLGSSREHCGACGVSCDAGEVCSNGACAPNCAQGQLECDGSCVVTATDPANCGGCRNACATGESCIDGSCEMVCAGGLTACGGSCADTRNDRNHCGGCGNVCGASEICSEGACVAACGGFAPTQCDDGCTNTEVDPLNCGACGTACGAGEVCSEGVCTGFCAPTLTECQDGACTSLQDDPNNCGGCGTVCTAATGALPVCAAGSCAAACAPGHGDCNGDLNASGGNGCEITFATDLDNCGACGIACPIPPNATRACDQGVCGIGTCQTGFENCDGNAINGCEIDTRSDDAHCGACGQGCNVDQFCSAGSCVDMVNADTCLSAPVLQAGTNTFRWFALGQDYITARPCGTLGNPSGPDLVFQYTPTFTGKAQVQFNNTTRAYAVVTQGTCDASTALACETQVSRVTPAFEVTANSTYFIHVVDSDSGTAVLPNPLTVTVTELDCATLAPTATVLSPENGATNPTLTGTFQVTFSNDLDTTKGSFTLTSNSGTTRTIPSSDPAVTWSNNGRTATIAAGDFAAGESITVTWTGLEDVVCAKPLPVAPWTVNMPVPACTPGQGGVVGATTTRIQLPFMPTTSLTDEQYILVDGDPNGWVYIGSSSKLYRVRKDGTGMPQDVIALGGMTASNYASIYEVARAGSDILVLKTQKTGTSGHIFRISADGGATFTNPEDVVTFPIAPGQTATGTNDWLTAFGANGSHVYALTFADEQETEIWTADLSEGTPATARLLGTFATDPHNYQFCTGAAVDAQYVYTTCRYGEPSSPYHIVKINRTTGAISPVGSVGLDHETMSDAIDWADLDGDGVADVLYQKADDDNARYVCSPHGTPYVDELLRWGSRTTNSKGLAYDRSLGVLWLYNDTTSELIKVQ